MRWAWVLIALVSVTCAGESPTAPSAAPSPSPGLPASLAVGFAVSRPGEAVITVTALDRQGRPVPNVRIAFGCAHGTVAPRVGRTTANGIVSTTVTARGRITVTARVTAPQLPQALKTSVVLTL